MGVVARLLGLGLLLGLAFGIVPALGAAAQSRPVAAAVTLTGALAFAFVVRRVEPIDWTRGTPAPR